ESARRRASDGGTRQELREQTRMDGVLAGEGLGEKEQRRDPSLRHSRRERGQDESATRPVLLQKRSLVRFGVGLEIGELGGVFFGETSGQPGGDSVAPRVR